MKSRRSAVVVGLAAGTLAVPLLAACGSSSSSSSSASASAVTVTAGDSSCDLSATTAAAGTTTFAVTNQGSQVTEVYVYGKDGDSFSKIVSEVENIGPGTSRDMSADLAAGSYEVACKPGQTGDGIRVAFTVTGTGGPTSASASATGALTEIPLTITGSALTGASGTSGKVGERVEFKVTNQASAMRNFEVKRADGSVAGETEIAAGKTGELTVELSAAGSWKLIVEGGSTEVTEPFPVS